MAGEINLTLPDGSVRKAEAGATPLEVASLIGPKLAKDALAAKVDGALVDLSTSLTNDSSLEIITFASIEGPEIYRHSASHIMAAAISELYPGAKFGIGPAIEGGFYYDFEVSQPIGPDDLERTYAKIEEIIARDETFTSEVMGKEEAIKLFKSLGQDYKVELIEDIEEDEIKVYKSGGFTDLCRGPHIPSSGRLKALKLLSLAGAYWRGDERRPMLKRIYGTAFNDPKDLKRFLELQEEALKRDHRKLGKELDLFSMDDDFGAGLVLWHPKGALIRKIVEDFWRDEHLNRGYELVMTPHIAKVDLWKTSGHWDFYRDNMYSPMDVEGQEYVIKPMNCPAHLLIFKSKTRSYRELPLRWAELGTVYRFERSGVLHGLLRVRGFTQDDAHIFCRESQIEDEIIKILDIVTFMLKTFGFAEYDIYVSTRPEKYVGDIEHWELATEALKKALDRTSLSYEIDPGEGVFYGPKIDIKIKDALGRAWQCSTIQVDFNNPERFDLTYMGGDNTEHRPIMIHRALLGSLERFMGCLIEHYVGAFPLWLAPIQAVILPIADRHNDYAFEVADGLRSLGLRVEVDQRGESVNKKIRDAQLKKMPYMVIVGDNEVEARTLSVRSRDGKEERGLELEGFIKKLKEEVDTKS
ncbi:MAG: threonine--tRNA ligase [Actinomycetota bacterium]|nr:threonine--tRNA ligase [Actinomycetota bacterium]